MAVTIDARGSRTLLLIDGQEAAYVPKGVSSRGREAIEAWLCEQVARVLIAECEQIQHRSLWARFWERMVLMSKKKATKKKAKKKSVKKKTSRKRLDPENPDGIELVYEPIELLPGAEKVMHDFFVRTIAKNLHDRLGGRVLSKKEMKILEDELRKNLPGLKEAFFKSLGRSNTDKDLPAK